MTDSGPPPATLAATLAQARATLTGVSESPSLDAEVLLMFTLGRERAWLRAWPEYQLSTAEREHFRELLNCRLEGWPIAYLTGQREFWSRSFRVGPGVLIPRPETELLIELALPLLPDQPGYELLDLGAGSGCLAITLAAERPQARVTATDASPEALSIAQDNARRLGVHNVRCLLGHWFSALADTDRYDLIVSNPPYIAQDDPHLTAGDLRFEPAMALASGPRGLDALGAIIAGARRHLKPGGTLLLEHGYDQADAVAALLTAQGYASLSQHRDLQGQVRATMAR